MKDEPKSPVLLYQTSDGGTRLEVRLENETVWLTQNQMAELFQTSIPNVSMHVRNVFAEGELQAGSVVKEFLTTAADGKNYQTKFYNLDVIISVGYPISLTPRFSGVVRRWSCVPTASAVLTARPKPLKRFGLLSFAKSPR